MNRRHFLGLGALAAGSTLIGATPGFAAKPAMATRLTILHTNDTHSNLDPMDRGEFMGMGGAEARAAFVRTMRQRHENVIVLDAGDILQGTPFFNLFQGEAEIAVMNAIGYDASAIGNHEFDAGIDRLAELVRDHAQFPFLCANYDFSATPMAGLARESMVIERSGLRVGMVGLGIRLESLVSPSQRGDTQYSSPLEAAERVAKHLREEEKCDFIIGLSHISIGGTSRSTGGEPGDRDVIRAVGEIDLVIGGHNHLLLPEPERHFRGREATMGTVAQAGWGGTHMGVLQFDIFERGKVELARATMPSLEAMA